MREELMDSGEHKIYKRLGKKYGTFCRIR